MKMKYLKSEVPQERYGLFLRGNLMILIGYSIVSVESFIAIYLGFTNLTYMMTLYICLPVLFISMIFTSVTCLKKSFLVWHEYTIFVLYIITFLIAFYFWIFNLGELRFLGILNCLTAITVVLAYTNIIQSLIMSMSAFLCYVVVIWYSIKVAGQPGSLRRETFLAFCILPAFLFIAMAANYMNKKRLDLQNAKCDLEKLNNSLSEANAKLKREQKITDIEMDLAGEIQRAIFPGKLPEVSDWDIAFMTKPYGTVSGDFYDFFYNENSLGGISLFDVSGHGVAPALITILAKPLICSNFNRLGSSRLGAVLEFSNSELMDELEEVNLYITGLLLRMNGPEVEYVNAGHPDLLHFKSSEKKVEAVTDPSFSFKGHPIGIMLHGLEYQSIKFTIESGDFLVLYSDGLTEGRNNSGELFGIKRLTNSISSFTGKRAAGLLEHISDTFTNFTGDVKGADDITIIVAGKI